MTSHQPCEDFIPADGIAVAHQAMDALGRADIPFLVAGAFALAVHTGIERHTKDFDIYLDKRDVEAALDALSAAGFHTEMESQVWLAKAYRDELFVDLIFNSGNAQAPVDDTWFDHALQRDVFGFSALICPPEEMIWSKAYVMERDRYDGADIHHIIRSCAEQIDWERLVARFGEHWRVLLSHLILFGFVYPARRDMVPDEVLVDLLDRARHESVEAAPKTDLCRGTLLSRLQYVGDMDRWGCQDARVRPYGRLSEEEARELSTP